MPQQSDAILAWLHAGLAAALVLATVAACANTDDAAPHLRLVSTVRLEEPADDPLARPEHIAVDSAGRLAVTDGRVPRVLVFGPDGKRIGVIGSEGSGPGEFQDARLAAFLPDGRVGVVASAERPGLFVFDLGSGEHVRSVPLDGVPSSVLRMGSDLVFGSIAFADSTAALYLSLATGERARFGPVPSEYIPGGPRAGIFHHVFPVPIGTDRFLLGFEALGEVVDVDRSTGEASRLRLPALRRRGVPENLSTRLAEALQRSYGEVFAEASALVFMAPAEGGRAVLVHHDFAAGMPPLPEAAFLSVLDVDAGRACADVPIPIDPNVPPAYMWHEGRLGVLQQEIEAERDAPAVLRWYEVELDRCRWQDLG